VLSLSTPRMPRTSAQSSPRAGVSTGLKPLQSNSPRAGMVVACGTAVAVGLATRWLPATALPEAALAEPNNPSPTSTPRATVAFNVVRRGTKRLLIKPSLGRSAQFETWARSPTVVGCISAPARPTLGPRFWSVNRVQDGMVGSQPVCPLAACRPVPGARCPRGTGRAVGRLGPPGRHPGTRQRGRLAMVPLVEEIHDASGTQADSSETT
jgi:hypothetical protein